MDIIVNADVATTPDVYDYDEMLDVQGVFVPAHPDDGASQVYIVSEGNGETAIVVTPDEDWWECIDSEVWDEDMFVKTGLTATITISGTSSKKRKRG